jgi:DNA-binding transcriptional MocR family regulator
MHQKLAAAHLAESLKSRATREIAVEMAALIRSGAIAVGTQLPAVRELAQALGVSPATISAAWSELKRNRVIDGRGRNGVWVCGNKPSPRPARFENVGNFGKLTVTDLTYAAPDPALLPDLSLALQHGAGTPQLNSYRRDPITDALRAAAAARWPYPAPAFMATNGGFDGLQATLQALLMPGSTVAIEDPTTVRLLDLLDNLGAHVLPVRCDAEGPISASLREALKHKPAAFIYQPRTHAVTCHTVSPTRMAELASVLADSDTLIIEDDGIGDVSMQPAVSLGNHYPQRCVHVVSYSKSLGPDLRLAVLSGPQELVEQIQAWRNFGASWTSRILQDAAAWMLADKATLATIAKARDTYHERRQTLIHALQQRGIAVAGDDGLSVWIAVPSEQFALVTLAVHGYAVFHGARFSLTPDPHIRVCTSLPIQNIDALADAIALCMDAI